MIEDLHDSVTKHLKNSIKIMKDAYKRYKKNVDVESGYFKNKQSFVYSLFLVIMSVPLLNWRTLCAQAIENEIML